MKVPSGNVWTVSPVQELVPSAYIKGTLASFVEFVGDEERRGRRVQSNGLKRGNGSVH